MAGKAVTSQAMPVTPSPSITIYPMALFHYNSFWDTNSLRGHQSDQSSGRTIVGMISPGILSQVWALFSPTPSIFFFWVA